VTPLERLRKAVELLPAGVCVTAQREALLEALGGAVEAPSALSPGDLTVADLAVADLAERFRRSPSTIRGWLETGRFPGAYKLNGRDWRVPIDGVQAFENHQRGRRGQTEVDLSGWRKYQKGP